MYTERNVEPGAMITFYSFIFYDFHNLRLYENAVT
jgi:hypothetical protein